MQLFKDTFPFLKDLADNNDREWFAEQKDRYTAVWEGIRKFGDVVAEGLNKSDVIETHKTFRIYRDVRFSKDKSPYKTHLGTHFVRATALRRGGYYLHIQPNDESFVAGGFWDPNKEDLKRFRDEFELDDKRIRGITADKNFIKHFGTLQGDALKTAPKGYDKEHPAVDLIRMKQYIVVKKFTDKQVMDKNFHQEVVQSFEAMRPFLDYMTEVVTTNLNGELIV